MEEKEEFRVGPKPIFINIFINKRDYDCFAQKGNQERFAERQNTSQEQWYLSHTWVSEKELQFWVIFLGTKH